MNRITLLVAVALASALIAVGVSAQTGAEPFSPGPVHSEHSDATCDDCHTPWKGVDDSKCLDCHEEVEDSGTEAGDLHSGFEGTCDDCHTDHKGTDASLTLISGEADHSLFDGECTDCHTDELRSSFPAGDHWESGCDDCHTTDDWTSINLNHDRFFRLNTEGHAGLGCRRCHPSSFQETTCSNGFGCHADGTLERWKAGGEAEEPGEEGEDDEFEEDDDFEEDDAAEERLRRGFEEDDDFEEEDD